MKIKNLMDIPITLEIGSNNTIRLTLDPQKEAQAQLRVSYNLSLQKGEDGWVIAKCPELHVATQGKTDSEAIRNAVDAIGLILEELDKNKDRG